MKTAPVEVALRLAHSGLFVFPCNDLAEAREMNGRVVKPKAPCVASWSNSSTTDAKDVRRLFGNRSDRTIGLDVGKSGLLVIDCDRHGDGPDGVEAFLRLVKQNGLPEGVPVVDTPSAGRHYFFSQPEGEPLGNREGLLPPGINVRGAGGYVIAPGSVRADGRAWQMNTGQTVFTTRMGHHIHELARPDDLGRAFLIDGIPVIPEWLERMLRPARMTIGRAKPGRPQVSTTRTFERVEPPEPPTEAERRTAYYEKAREREVGRVIGASEGERNNRLNEAAFNLGQLIQDGGLPESVVIGDLLNAAHYVGLGHEEALKTIESGIKGGRLKPRERKFSDSASADPFAPPRKKTVEICQGSDVSPEALRWLWTNWLARGKLQIIGGQPGTGKTTIALAFAATVTRGGQWPDGTSGNEPGNALFWSGEDDFKDTIAPRLHAMGADMKRIYFVSGVTEDNGKRSFDPAKDVTALAEAATKIEGGVALIIVDPIVSAVAGDSHKNSETRRALQPLVDMAQSLDAALLGVTHFTKGTSGREPLERVTGSLAFGAVARIVLVAAKGNKEEDGPARVLARAKSNIGPDGGGFAYDLQLKKLVPHFPDITASCVEWGEALDGTARELLAKAEGNEEKQKDGGAFIDALEFLRAFLAEGPKTAKEVKDAANEMGLKWRTVERAKAALHVTVTRKRFGANGSFEWKLSEGERDDDPF